MKKVNHAMLAVIAAIFIFAATAMGGQLLGSPKFQAFDSDGDPLTGGLVYTYSPGTTTDKATYSDRALSSANANPVVLDSRGEASVYLDGTTKFVLKTAAGVTIWTMDYIDGVDQAYGANRNYVDAGEADQGAAGSGDSVKDFVDAAGSDGTTLVFRHTGSGATTTYTFSTSITIPANITLEIEKGAILTVDSGDTLTINSPGKISSSLNQIFTGSGLVAFTIGGSVYPEWWGAVGDNSTTCTTAINDAIDSIETVGGNVLFGAGTYVSGTIEIPSMVVLRGQGHAITTIKAVAALADILVKTDNYSTQIGTGNWLLTDNVRYSQGLTGLTINGNNTATIGVALYAKNLILDDLWITYCTSDGFRSECGTATGHAGQPGYDNPTGAIGSIVSCWNGGNGFTIDGPHDSVWRDLQSFRNIGHGVYVDDGGAGDYKNIHTWGNDYGDPTDGTGSYWGIYTKAAMRGWGQFVVEDTMYVHADAANCQFGSVYLLNGRCAVTQLEIAGTKNVFGAIRSTISDYNRDIVKITGQQNSIGICDLSGNSRSGVALEIDASFIDIADATIREFDLSSAGTGIKFGDNAGASWSGVKINATVSSCYRNMDFVGVCPVNSMLKINSIAAADTGHFVSLPTIRYASNQIDIVCAASGGATVHYSYKDGGGIEVHGDAADTLLPQSDVYCHLWTTELAANRAVGLSTTSASSKTKFRIVHSVATGANTLDVGALKSLAAAEWCEVAYDPSTAAYVLTAYGSL